MMTRIFCKILIGLFVLLLIACSSNPTRESEPEKFELIQTGQVKKENILKFKTCFVAGSDMKNRIAYNVRSKEKVMVDGFRVDSYGGNVFLLLSADILHSGLTRLYRVQNSALTDLSQQIRAFDVCLLKYQ